MWKQIRHPYSKYSVNDSGQVRNNKTGRILRTSTCAAYDKIRLSGFGQGRTFLVHRLVAEAHLSQFYDTCVVHHIDQNKKNNHVDNLECTTQKQNIRYARELGIKSGKQREVNQYGLDGTFLKTWPSLQSTGFQTSNISSCCAGHLRHAYGFIWRYVDDANLDGEIWRKHVSGALASNLGRIRLRRGKISKFRTNTSGYHTVLVRGQHYMAHHIIAKSWLEAPINDKMQINHKNGIKVDNRVENLEWVTPSENVKHAWLSRKNAHTNATPVKSISADGKETIFASIKEASIFTGVSKGNIHSASVGHRRSAGGFTWKKVNVA